MRYLDLFAGYGGFSLGIKQAYAKNSDWNWRQSPECRQNVGVSAMPSEQHSGKATCDDSEQAKGIQQRVNHESLSSVGKSFVGTEPLCVGFSEINEYAIQVYQKHFPQHQNYGDITKIDPTTIPDFDLLVGGFPCQAFSIAGKRGGFDDTRGTLVFDVLRICKEKQPRFVVLENVKGLLSHDSGRTFKTIVTALAELGYAVEWQVLNAKNFGVPQNRERVFIVGHLGGFSGRQIFPFTESNPINLREITQEVSDAQRIYDKSGLAKSQKSLGGGRARKLECISWTTCKFEGLFQWNAKGSWDCLTAGLKKESKEKFQILNDTDFAEMASL